MAPKNKDATGVAATPDDTIDTDAERLDAGTIDEAPAGSIFAVINPRFHLIDQVELLDSEDEGGDGSTYEFTHEPRGVDPEVYERLAAGNKWPDGDVKRQVIVRAGGDAEAE